MTVKSPGVQTTTQVSVNQDLPAAVLHVSAARAVPWNQGNWTDEAVEEGLRNGIAEAQRLRVYLGGLGGSNFQGHTILDSAFLWSKNPRPILSSRILSRNCS